MALILAFGPSCRPFFHNDRVQDVTPGTEHAYDMAGSPGSLASELASSRHFSSLTIEIQPVQGMSPSQESLNRLFVFLRKYLNKPGGLRLEINSPIPPPLHPPGQSGYTLQDVRRIEANHRKHYTTKGKLAVFVLYLDWQSADDECDHKTLGQAHQTSSIVIYKNTLKSLSQGQPNSPIPSYARETTVLLHEFGHLLGLVGMDNQGRPNEDPAHPFHCSNPACLMHSSVEKTIAGSTLGNPIVPQLDETCERELNLLRSGR